MQTYNEIEEQINTEVAANPLLTGLTSSQASEWKAWKSIFIFASLSLQFLWEQFKAEILGLLKQEKLGRPEWYVANCFSYQDGDELINNNGLLGYAAVDASKKIITQAAAVASQGKVLLKVATEDGVLTVGEKARFNDYWEAMKPFALPLQIVSELPDKVKSTMTITYDGKLLLADVEAAVEAAITNYLTNKIAFNGDFNINRFRDAIEEAIRELSSENDVNITVVQIRTASGPYLTVAYKYAPLSGRYLFGFPDDATPTDQSTITYVAA